jgi:peptidoglycan/LPS O-acetylase OafA/YrhL
MAGHNEDEKHQLLHPDDDSVHSFESGSTLNSSPVSEVDDEEKDFGLLATEHEIFSTSQLRPTSWRKTPLKNLIPRISKVVLFHLLPSFFFSRGSKRKLHPTSYLDGLRGIAALIVFIDHFILNWYFDLRHGYFNTPEDAYVLQLPFIRLLFAGRASVGVFFVISGFVLSHKSLKQIRSGERSRVLDSLSSSVFRRGMRLNIPIFFGTFISMLLAYNELYMPVPARSETIPPTFLTLTEQFWDWWAKTMEVVFPFRGVDPNSPYGPVYNGHLWTIPIEFYGSIVVFATVLGLSRVRNSIRMTLVAGLATWSLQRGRWDIWLFLGGVFLAEYSLLSSSPPELNLPTTHTFRERSSSSTFLNIDLTSSKITTSPTLRILLKTLAIISRLLVQILTRLKTLLTHNIFSKPLNLLLFTTSLFLLSYAGESSSPGFYHSYLPDYTPQLYLNAHLGAEHFWISLGSVLLVFTLIHSSLLQRIFTTPFAQYLGDISYALYIVHGMVLFTLGTQLQERWTGQVGWTDMVENAEGELVEEIVREEYNAKVYGRAFVVCALINTVVVFWAADLFWRLVDGRAVRWGRWVEGLVLERRER